MKICKALYALRMKTVSTVRFFAFIFPIGTEHKRLCSVLVVDSA